MLKIRDATSADLNRIMKIYRYAQEFMIRTGNPHQWGYVYPDEALIRADIRDGLCKVVCDESGVHGVFALPDGEEPTYRRIENGAWLNDEPYVTIHRIAGDGQAHGLFQCAADYCKRISDNVRVDTHADNRIMQKLIERNGFLKCGTVYVRDGSPRIAYQWKR
ncbi:MAG: N-acetyltransferase [Oscillospiraceae bacterium]|nr:N-acetyltransferase [Oscillospiraceae bacterium]